MKTENYGTNWEKINLESGWERDLNLIENLQFSTLLLEIHCNLPEINSATVREQFEMDLQGRVDEAREIFEANLQNIVKRAQQERVAE